MGTIYVLCLHIPPSIIWNCPKIEDLTCRVWPSTNNERCSKPSACSKFGRGKTHFFDGCAVENGDLPHLV